MFARVCLIGVLSLLASCAAQAPMAPIGLPAFYTASPSELAGAPGTLIRQEDAHLAVAGARAYRLLYRSAGAKGEPVAVSAVVFVPDVPARPGGRPVVVWNHPTTGIMWECAPSLSPDAGLTIPGLAGMIAAGYAVVATDYPGLGTPGPHPYLVGASEGRAVLDGVRAARAFQPAEAGTRFAVWGHSQGGHASLFAAAMARDYAPELQLAAPATGLAMALHPPAGVATSDSLFAMVLWSWSNLSNTPLAGIVREQDVPNVRKLAAACWMPAYSGARQPPDVPDPDDVPFTPIKDFAATSPWKEMLALNSPGPTPAGVPVLLVQGGKDTVIPAALTDAYVAQLRAAGVAPQRVVIPDADHRVIGQRSAAVTLPWLAERFK